MPTPHRQPSHAPGPAAESAPGPAEVDSQAAGPPAPDAASAAGDPALAGAVNPIHRLVSGAEPVVSKVASAVGSAVGSGVRSGARVASRGLDELPGARVRRLRRVARVPLPSLFEVHPDARRANPREIGLRTIDVAEILGTAVAGPTQRGSDFLPLKPFRSVNWLARWQRIRSAVDKLAILPPVDVVRYGDGYWVTDGHNRVAAALYAGQVGIDANVTELVAPGAAPRERGGSLAASLVGSRELRSAGTGLGGPVLHDHELHHLVAGSQRSEANADDADATGGDGRTVDDGSPRGAAASADDAEAVPPTPPAEGDAGSGER